VIKKAFNIQSIEEFDELIMMIYNCMTKVEEENILEDELAEDQEEKDEEQEEEKKEEKKEEESAW